MIETQRGIRVKLGVLVVLVSMAWLSSSAAEASKILFKSEVAGTDFGTLARCPWRYVRAYRHD